MGKKSVTTFVQGSWADYKNSDIYWGEDVAVNGDFSSLTAEQKAIVAHALGYDVYTNGAWINPAAPAGKQVITQVAAAGTSPDYRLEDIDWGGVPAPEEGTSFEALTIAQKKVVLAAMGYVEFKGAIYFNADTKTLLPTVAYTIAQVNWEVKTGETTKNYQPAEGTPFDKLSPSSRNWS
jgi:hypothetical protein